MAWNTGDQAGRLSDAMFVMVVFTASSSRVVNAVGSRAATPWSCWAAELSEDRHTIMSCKVDENAA